ncbi:DUF58 domain-containing protein [Cryobacterium sp. SO2]|uniref:DUF58 domain-containing protein n=1 Tax=Cryobacterium sp. SO2 TaxID=1897060 RepID=UPI00223DF047|nr:DUF58 domain-containing protein [Cryobacterium sp. SO2]WEO75931.1 DUF58 domain-containing protein [Cryobacterium sp. SO2]
MTWSGSTSPASRARRLVRPTLRGGLFLGVGSALFIVAWAADQRDLIFVAALLLLVPLVALGYVLVHPVRVSVTRARPATVSAGLSATVTIQVSNVTSLPLAGLRWRDTAASGVVMPAAQPLRALGPARPGHQTPADTAVLSYQVRLPRRGVYPIGPMMLGRVDPFGLAYSEWPVGAPHDLTVTPRVTPLPGNGVSITRGEGSRHERLRHLNNDSDELIAREYRPGDPMRRVNWPATARHGEIMVRQEEQRSHPEARVLLDTTRGGAGHRDGDGGFGTDGTRAADRHGAHSAEFEVAVELAASIAVHLLEAGFRVDTVELGPAQLVPSPIAPRASRSGQSRPSVNAETGRLGGLRGDDTVSFTGPEGERALLDALAQVVRRDHLAAAGGGAPGAGGRRAGIGGGQIPTFAVLIDTDAGDTADLVDLRGLCQPAVAFVFDTMSAAAVDHLADAGWQCVPVSAHSGVEAAWLLAGQDRGDRRGQY